MVPFSRITFGEKVSDSVFLQAYRFLFSDCGLFKEVFPSTLPPPSSGVLTDDWPGIVPSLARPSNIYSTPVSLPSELGKSHTRVKDIYLLKDCAVTSCVVCMCFWRRHGGILPFNERLPSSINLSLIGKTKWKWPRHKTSIIAPSTTNT